MKKIKTLFKFLIFWLRTKRFSRLKIHDTCKIVDTLGSAGFLKTGKMKALCLDSQDGTYQKSQEYTIESHTRVFKTCK